MAQSYAVQYDISQSLALFNHSFWNNERNKLIAEIKNIESNLLILEVQKYDYAGEILKEASKNFEKGEIDFFDFLQSIESVKEIELNYLS